MNAVTVSCPTCGSDNPSAARFCSQCGSALPQTCPNCGRSNPAEARFCNQCGTGLQGAAAPAQPPVPTTEAEAPAERRVASILFCDVTGSTAAARDLDPEEWTEIMNGAFERMTRPIERYGGTVARLMGDAILALFGAPVAHEDDPERAVLAGLDIVASIADYRASVAAKFGVELDVRVGINTGLVRVGRVGSDVASEYTAMGDAINVAARMEQTAEAGTVQVSEYTYRLVAHAFQFESLGSREVKGRQEPIPTYRPVRVTPRTTIGRKGAGAPLVGRTTELDRLLGHAADLGRGIGRIVLVVGEAGIGKSRLVSELRSQLADVARWLEAPAFSYEMSSAYVPLQRLLRGFLEVDADAPVEVVEDRLRRDDIPGDAADTLRALFGLPSTMEGEGFQRRLATTVQNLFGAAAGEQPTVVVLDDLHWFDPASVEAVTPLLDVAADKPLLLVGTTRVDRDSPGWELREAAESSYWYSYSELRLDPLDTDAAGEMLEDLLRAQDLPRELIDGVIAQTDGNPFFIEELTTALVEAGALTRSGGSWRLSGKWTGLSLPGSLQGLLGARIDRLQPQVRRTLQLAAVIGRTFYRRVLAAIEEALHDVSADLDDRLTVLERAELIRKAARAPDLEYAFRHALTQEAAYETVLLRDRPLLHRHVAETLEAMFSDRRNEMADRLAHHFFEADDPRAFEYLALAGDAALRLYAKSEAITHYRRALQVHETHPEAIDAVDLTHVYLRLGRALELADDYEGALDVYRALVDLGEATDDEEMVLHATLAQAVALAVPTQAQDGARAREKAGNALELARRRGDEGGESRALWALAIGYMYDGQMGRGREPAERSVEIARRTGSSDQLAQSLSDLAISYMAAGRLRESFGLLQEARPIWMEQGNLPMVVETLSSEIAGRLYVADFSEALRLREQAQVLSAEADNRWGELTSRSFLGMLYRASGDIDGFFIHVAESLPLALELKHPSAILLWHERARMWSLLGRRDQAFADAEEGGRLAEQFVPFLPMQLALLTELHLAVGNLDEARRAAERAEPLRHVDTIFPVEVDRRHAFARLAHADGDRSRARHEAELLDALVERSGARYYWPQSRLLLSRTAPDRSTALAEARAALEASIATDDKLWRIPILGDLARLDDERGRTHVEAADAVASSIASNISDETLQADFLAAVRLELGESLGEEGRR